MLQKKIHRRIREELEKATVKIITDHGSIGTGFFITPDGYLVTAYHCLENRNEPDQTAFNLRFVFSDGTVRSVKGLSPIFPGTNRAEGVDRAVLKTSHKPPAFLPLGRITRENRNDKVIAVGYAAGHKEVREIGFYSGEISSFVGECFEVKGAIQGSCFAGP